ncbi:MAG: flagellar hook-length control protein FliK [Oscillospiraceae bacterium]|nr:flagellar hook-length control protein FliK [Oscillospiraceae bacterium]
MSNLNLGPANSVRSVGGTSQKNINNNTGRPNRTLENLRNNRGGGILSDGVNTRELDSSYLNRLNEINANSVKTINTDIINKALRDAGIEITRETLDIVNSLVNGSMPLTENNIIDLLEYSRMFKSASADTLALMMKLEIPITADNIVQFEKLAGENEKLAVQISEFIDKLPAGIIENCRSLPQLFATLFNILDIFSNPENINPGNSEILYSPEVSGVQPAESESPASAPVLNLPELNGLLNILIDLNAPDEVLNRIIEASSQTANPAPADVILDIIKTFILELESQNPVPVTDSQTGQNTQNAQNSQVNPQANSNANVPADMSINNADTPEVMQTPRIAQTATEESMIFDKIKDLLDSAAFSKLLKESAQSKWLIEPKDFEPGKIEDFFNKLNGNLNRIENRFARLSAGSQSGETQVYSDAKNIRDNLSVMNEISRTMPFMQIPVKLANQILNGDLYIFKNKRKNKGKGENPSGSINALLRLDLENAGSLDVYINLSGKNVRSRFCPHNIKSAGEIEKRLPELEETISKMGFNFSGETSPAEKGFDFAEDFVNRGVPKTEIRKYILNLKI